MVLQVVFVCSADALFADQPTASRGRFAVLKFEGINETPRGSQFILDARSEEVFPPETVVKPVCFIIAADVHANEVWLFARISPWRVDAGRIDSEQEYLWHQTKESTSFIWEKKRSRWDKSIWAMQFKSVFAEIISLDNENDMEKVVESVVKVCSTGFDDMAPLTLAYGETLVRRIPSSNGKTLVVNRFQSGEIVSAFRMDIDYNRFQLVSHCFSREKPVEIKRGELSVAVSDHLPPDIERALVYDEAPKVSLTTAKGQKVKGNVSNLLISVLWFAGAGFLTIVVCLLFLGRGNKNDQSC